VVLKTFAGLAQAVATGLDAIESHDILGCVAGDDCIILVARTHDAAKDISERIKTMLKSI
jgi:transcriptional regulator of arginine metabolism